LIGLGAVIGAVLTTWVAPHVIVWYFDPPAQFGFNCRAPIEWSLKRFQISQMVGIVLGAIGGLTLSLTVFRGKSEELPPAV
jgi:hypothetical protein